MKKIHYVILTCLALLCSCKTSTVEKQETPQDQDTIMRIKYPEVFAEYDKLSLDEKRSMISERFQKVYEQVDRNRTQEEENEFREFMILTAALQRSTPEFVREREERERERERQRIRDERIRAGLEERDVNVRYNAGSFDEMLRMIDEGQNVENVWWSGWHSSFIKKNWSIELRQMREAREKREREEKESSE